MLDTKYGKIMRASPQTRGTTARCFLPYTKKPSPHEPYSKPQRSHDSFNVSPAAVERRGAELRGLGLHPSPSRTGRQAPPLCSPWSRC